MRENSQFYDYEFARKLIEEGIWHSDNQVVVSGTITDDLTEGIFPQGTKYYSGNLRIEERGRVDFVPFIIDQKMSQEVSYAGKPARIYGIFDSNYYQTKIFIFGKKIDILEEEQPENFVFLEGRMMSYPFFKRNSEINMARIELVVSKKGMPDPVIPCIAWRSNEQKAETFEIGDCIKVIGRIQSRSNYSEDETFEVLVFYVENYDIVRA